MIGAVLLMAALQLQESDPLAPAARGEMQCYTPDVARKTCRAMAGYRRQGDGSYRNQVRVLLQPDGFVMQITVTGHLVEDAFCWRNEEADILAGKLFADGEEVPEEDAEPILMGRAHGNGGPGKPKPLICNRYIPDGDALKSVSTANGVPQPDWDERVIWVRPDQGFRVAP